MAVAWALNVWATNSWVGMNGGPPNAWLGASTPSPAGTTTGGVGKGRKRELRVKFADIRDRVDTAEFIKQELRKRHPDSAFDYELEARNKAAELATAKREKDLRDKATLLAAMEARELRTAQEKKLLDENNEAIRIITMIANKMDDL